MFYNFLTIYYFNLMYLINSFHGILEILKRLVEKNRYYIKNIKYLNLKMTYLFTKFLKIIQHL